MLTYLLGPMLSLLPQRWRKHLFARWEVDWVRATLLSGLLFGFGCLLGLALWYLAFITAASDAQAAVTAQALNTRGNPQGMTGVDAGYAMGLSGLIAFALHPLTLLLAYYSAEGAYRAIAAVVNGEAPGSGPLALADAVAQWWRRRSYERRVPLVADKVTCEPDGKEWNLKVESCRPKPLWKLRKVVKYGEGFFQVLGESPADATRARPHVYLLRSAPAGEAFRGMEVYDANEPLRPGPPTVGQSAVRAFRDSFRLKTLPLVADQVERIVNDDGVFLRIESCRPKRDWPAGRIIRYEGCLYRLAEAYEAAPPRPFGFQLQLLHTVGANRRVVEYSPDEVLRKS